MVAKRRLKTNPGSFRFRLGKFECVSINDGIFNYPLECFFANAPVEQVKEALRRRSLPTEQIITPSTCLFVDTGQHRLLVDTGAGALGYYARHMLPNIDHATTVTGRLLENMRAAGVEPSEIDLVIITHAQPEHLGGILDENGELIFANAWFLISSDEWDFWASNDATTKISDATLDAGLVGTSRLHLMSLRQDQLDFFEEEREIVPGITVIPTPGHTPGHTAVSISSDAEQLLHISDAVLHPLQLEHPQWVSVFDLSPEDAAASKQMLFDRAAEEEALVFAHHFPPFPNLGHVGTGDEGWQWEPLALD